MLGANKLALWISTGVFAVTTVFYNGFILSMSLRRSREQRQWSPSESIIVALAVANVLHQLVCYFWMTMDEMDIKCHIEHMAYTVILLLIFSLKFTIMWDTSFLTFYYSVKLVATPNACYTHIQALILKHVSAAVLLIPLMGLATCMPMLLVFHADNQTAAANQDCGVLVPDTQAGKIYEVIYLLFSDVLPGVVMVKCCVSISVHLYVHLRHMKASTNGVHRPRLGTQIRVIQMSLTIVALFSLFLVVDLYVNYQIAVNHENAINLTFFFTSMYTSGVAAVLLYGKKPLWKALLQDYNLLVDHCPCMSCLKVPEQRTRASTVARGGTERTGGGGGPGGSGSGRGGDKK